MHYFTCLPFLILIFNCLTMTAQPADNQSYENVYVIKDDQVTIIGDQYLLDLPVRKKEETVVLFNASEIPNELFWTSPYCYPNQKEIILIDNVSFSGDVCGGDEEEEPVAEFDVFTIKRTNNKTTVDSVRIYNVTITEKTPEPIAENEIKYFFSERYGSTCCPRDEKWDNVMRAETYLAQYEAKNKHSAGSVWQRITGKEGEHAIFYTLDRLEGKQRLDFILGRQHTLIPNVQLKKYKRLPNLFTVTIEENWRIRDYRER